MSYNPDVDYILRDPILAINSRVRKAIRRYHQVVRNNVVDVRGIASMRAMIEYYQSESYNRRVAHRVAKDYDSAVDTMAEKMMTC